MSPSGFPFTMPPQHLHPGLHPSQVHTQVTSYTIYPPQVGMKTDRIRTDITDIVFVFIFMSGFGFEYG
jgi:hypothetical protein